MGNTTFKLGAELTLKDLISAPFAKITGNADALKSKLAEIDGGVKQFESSMKSLKIGGGMMAAGTGVALALKSTLDPAKSFQSEMAVLQGTAKAGADEMALFSKAALKAGVDTKFSPDEAVKGLTALSSQGLNATQAVNMLIPSLDLAAAATGKISIDEAAKVTAEVMNSFGIASEKAAGVTDVFTRMTQLSSFQFDQLGAAFRGVNLVAASANQSLEGTASVMMALKSGGATAVGAGQKFRMALQNLQTPSDGAAAAIDRLGVSSRDSSGEMRPMVDIFADMDTAMKGMNTAHQDYYKEAILGVEGMTAYNAVMQASVEIMDDGVKKTLKGVEAVRYFEKELKDSGGSTAEFAELQIQTWQGAQEILAGVWTTVKLVFGQTFIPALTAATKAVTAILSPILDFMLANEGIRKAVAWTVAGAAGFLLFGGAVMIARGFFGLLRLTAIASMNPFRGIGNAVAFLKTQLLGIIPFIKAKTVALWQKTAALTASGVSALKSGVAFVWHKTAMIAGAVATKVMAAAQWALNAAFIASPIGWIVLGILALGAAVYGIVKYWDLIKEKAVGAWNWIKSVWGGAPDWVKGLFSKIQNSISGFFGGLWGTIYEAGAKIISTLWEGIKSKAVALKDGVKDVFNGVRNLLPFSDAKEGPFSNLTYSGQSIIKTLNSGIEQEGNKTPAVLPYMKKSADVLQDKSFVSGNSPGGINSAGGFVLNAGNLIGTINLKGTSKSGNINELAQAMANLLYEQFLRAQNA